MTEHLHEKGERDREHRDTGRQRSEPEEGKHARQPERPTGDEQSSRRNAQWGLGAEGLRGQAVCADWRDNSRKQK